MIKELKARLRSHEFENSDDLLVALEQMSYEQQRVVLLAYDLGHDAGFEEAEEE